MKNKNIHQPPKYALRFLRWYCSEEKLEEIEGDLEECFFIRLKRYSPEKAKWLYWLDVIRCFKPYAWKNKNKSQRNTNFMLFKNYLLFAQRQLFKSKLNGIINISGLSLGITICLLVTLFVNDEYSFDKFHKKGKRIYKLNTHLKYYGDEYLSMMTSPIMLPTFKEVFPWIEDGTRLRQGITYVKDVNQEILREPVYYIDETFFEIFDFPLLYGDKNTALSTPNSIVLDEPTALRITGKTDPIGEIIELKFGKEMYNFNITGIAKKFPENSSIRITCGIPMSFYESIASEERMTNWMDLCLNTLILLKDNNLSQQQIEEELTTFFLKQHPNNDDTEKDLQVLPFESLHLSSFEYGLGNGLVPESDPMLSYMLAAIGFFILLLACINFTNISIATAIPRSREVGIRKVLRAYKSNLFLQFLTETAFNAFISFSIAILLCVFLLPFFNELTDKQIVWQAALNWKIVLTGIGIYLLIILMAGSYPAWVISRFQVMKSLKSKQRITGRQHLNKLLLITQFAIAIFFIGILQIINEQLHFLTKSDLGYNSNGLINIQAYGENIPHIAREFRNAFAQNKIYAQVSFNGGFGNSTYVKVNDQDIESYHECMDYSFIDLMGIKLKEGRLLNAENKADETKNVIVNEAFVKKAGWNEPIGKHIQYNYYDNMEDVQVVGVINDFHFTSLHEEIKPLLLHVNPEGVKGEILIKTRSGNEANTVKLVENVWKKTVFFRPILYYFQEDNLKQAYQKEQMLLSVISNTSFIAVFISLFGLFGIVGVALNQRTKEIGVRKVLGATYLNIYQLISHNFLIIIVLAFFLAIPAIWLVSAQWLQNFAYNVSIGVMPYFLAGLTVFLIAVVTITFRIYLTMMNNPIKALRDE